MSVRVTERAIRATGDGRDVKIGISHNQITITRLCGASCWFTVKQMQRAVANVESMRDLDEDAWVKVTSSEGGCFYVRVIDGQLYASDSPRDLDQGCVKWKDFKRALAKSYKQLTIVPSTTPLTTTASDD